VLFLDEPGTGVDPVSRKEFWDMLRRLRTADITILVSTAYMDEAELCDRVGLMQKGEILAIDTPAGIRNSYRRPLFAARSEDMYRLIRDLREITPGADCYAFGEYAHLALPQTGSVTDIQTYLKSKGHEQIEVSSISATVEDCFIELMTN
jgi:ABC-type multidrug transport system ATPase subunit